MSTLRSTIDAYVASREVDRTTLSRLAFWNDELGALELAAITPEEVDQALVRLAERGRLRPLRNRPSVPGKPIAGSTLNGHISQFQNSGCLTHTGSRP